MHRAAARLSSAVLQRGRGGLSRRSYAYWIVRVRRGCLLRRLPVHSAAPSVRPHDSIVGGRARRGHVRALRGAGGARRKSRRRRVRGALALRRFGRALGRFLVRGGESNSKEGAARARNVVVRWRESRAGRGGTPGRCLCGGSQACQAAEAREEQQRRRLRRPDLAAAEACYASPAYRAALVHGVFPAATRDFLIVDGV